MCVAILKPYDKSVTREDMEKCFRTNPHGAGFMYPKDGRVVVVKGLFDFESFWKAYTKHEEGPAKNIAMSIHFRIATSGMKDKLNCHPHVIAQDAAFIHNGVMSEYAFTGKGKDHKSDTVHFMESILRPLYEKFGAQFLGKADLFHMIAKYIGTYNKMVFMDPKHYWIMNEKMGDWIGGVWYSNTSWRTTYQPVARTYGNDRWPGGHMLPQASDKEAKTEADTTTSATGTDGGDSKLRSCTRTGCWLPDRHNAYGTRGAWVSWHEYCEIYPKFDGPYEWYLQGRASPDSPEGDMKGVRVMPAKVEVFEAGKKKEDCPPCASQEPASTPPAELSEATTPKPEKSLEEAVLDGAPGEIWPESRCAVCIKEMDQREIEEGEGVCFDCLFEICRTKKDA